MVVRRSQVQIHAHELLGIILDQEQQLETLRLQVEAMSNALQATREHVAMLTESIAAPADNPFLQRQAE